MQRKTARISVLIDAGKKAALEAVCHSLETTPSQVVRSLISNFMLEHSAPAIAGKAKPRKPK